MEYFNDTLNRFQDLLVRNVASNISVSLPARMEWIGDGSPKTVTDALVTVYIFPTAYLVSHSDSHSSHLLASIGTSEVLLHDIDTSTPEWRVVLPAIDDAFLQSLVTLHIEARHVSAINTLEDFYTPKFKRVVLSLAEM